MKRFVLILTLVVICVSGYAQNSGEQKEWLVEFSAVKIKAPANITFIKVAEGVAPQIVYDTKGSYTSKFEYEVKNKTLYITERTESRRTTQTEVEIHYNSIDKIDIQAAKVTFDSPITRVMFDAIVGAGANVTLPLDVQDSRINVSDKSKLTLTGVSRYMQVNVSSAELDASELECMSAMVKATTNAKVSINVSDRIEASTSTKATIDYKGNPQIIRGDVSFFGGEIIGNN